MRIDLSGRWSFDLDPEKTGVEKGNFNLPLWDQITLPGTVSSNQLGSASDVREAGFLTDPYAFEGYAWFTKYLSFDQFETHEYYLVMERSRHTHIWIDDDYVDSHDSLVAPHEYFLSPYIKKKRHRITILVDNSSYRIKGGHMTSPDTQTNWNGIVGDIYLEARPVDQLRRIRLETSYLERRLDVSVVLQSEADKDIHVRVKDGDDSLVSGLAGLSSGLNEFRIQLPETIEAWSEHSPKLYSLELELDGELYQQTFGVRDFKAVGRHFEVNGERTFLRGKHDGMIFPLTGYAPMDVESWLEIMKTAKNHGINHYRFHTACPPDAAFTAADQLGIYMEPELPFWGTITTEADEEHDGAAEGFLLSEGFRMLDAYGNHPSFVMMSLGNELWGSKERIDEILGMYKSYDSRILYTAGSNNHQFMPSVLSNEDFFVGVRFSQDRLFRGSYAMCDAPQGHIQTQAPNSSHNYDAMIVPPSLDDAEAIATASGEISIQYGTGTKTVKSEATEAIVPEVPVLSHEIGQYGMYPNYAEIEKYTGVLKAHNLEIFRERLEAAGMLHLADRFHRASGRLAVDAYKAELEAALASHELAGYQILDLQDFSGQGTALVGILDAFMDSKNLISPEAWREFCSDQVILAAFDRFIFKAGETVLVPIRYAHYARETTTDPRVSLRLFDGTEEVFATDMKLTGAYKSNLFDLGVMTVELPQVDTPKQLELLVEIEGEAVQNHYKLWVYPEVATPACLIVETADLDVARRALEAGSTVLLYPTLSDDRSIEGTYCTDFWNYPMFRSISESMGKAVPVGTMGLAIDAAHPIFGSFPTEDYTTAQWYDIVSASRVQILDDTLIEPIAQMIDNVERNHRLGLIWDANVADGKLMVVTAALNELENSLPAAWLRHSILAHLNSEAFAPTTKLSLEQFDQLFA